MDEAERDDVLNEMTECPMCGQPVRELVLFVREQEMHRQLREARRAWAADRWAADRRAARERGDADEEELAF
jgi:hypothetical protein